MGDAPLDEAAIFDIARKIEPLALRADYLEQVCGNDAALRRRVGALLAVYDEEQSFLVSPPSGVEATVDMPRVSEGPGTVIGHYKLLQQIGEGGFGIVYMAEQEKPVQRKVALKIIKPGMDTKEVIARFEAERQALAMMDHPNIARVLDAGATGSGRPYFVMELVRGIPVTKYCDQNNLPTRDRLELFVSVCQAVQHAHQKGVIHRDIKPTNVMVTLHDGKPVVKVIDFGIAKAINRKLTDRTLFTSYSQMIGTPLYMSPEQAEMSGLDVDTRTDIYSLGVLLYELLTGSTPFDRDRIREAAFDEIRRIIREEEPPKPSTKVSTLGAMGTSVSAHRKTDAKKLSQMMRGDLDWIVMKSLEKDRTRRYETANGFASDVLRYLGDEPVTACPPSAAYKMRKFARRNKAALATAAAIALALIVGTVVSTWQAVRATRAEALAARRLEQEQAARREADAAHLSEARQRVVAENERDRARAAEKRAQQQRDRAVAAEQLAEANFAKARAAVDEYFTTISQTQLLNVPGLQPLREELLRAALHFYEGFVQERADDPQLRLDLADAHYRIGRIYSELGEKEKATEAHKQARAMYEGLIEAEHDDPRVKLGLAKVHYFAQEQTKTVELCKQILEVDPAHTEAQRTLADAYNALAIAKNNDATDLAEALKLHQQALEIREALVRAEPENPENLAQLAGTVNNIGTLLAAQGKRREALVMYRRALEYMAQAREQIPHVVLYARWMAIGHSNVAHMEEALGNRQAALEALQRLVQTRRQLVVDHPAVPGLKGELFQAYRRLGNQQRSMDLDAEARRSYRTAQEILENQPREQPGELFDLATIYGALAGSEDDGQPAGRAGQPAPDAEQTEERRRYAELAMEAVRQAVDAGFRNIDALKKDQHLAVIRDREEFQQLLSRLEQEVEARRLAATTPQTDEQKLEDRRAALKLLKDLAEQAPAETRHRTTLAATAHSIGVIQTGLKQFDEAQVSLNEALRIRAELRIEQPDDPALAVDWLATRVAIGQLYWESARFPEGHRIWQECSHELHRIAEAHRDNEALQQRIAAEERVICNGYGRYGIWPLAGEYVRRAVEFRRVSSDFQDAEFSALLLLPENAAAADEYVAMLAAAPPHAADDRETFRIHHLVRTAVMSRAKTVTADDLVARARKALAMRNGSPWWSILLATALYRAGEFQEAHEVIGPVDEIGSHVFARPQSLYVKSIVASALDNDSEARAHLARGEERYKQASLESLSYPAVNSLGLPTQNWHELIQMQAQRREALQLIQGEEPADDPWQRLIQARGYRLIGEIEKADAELAAAVAAAPEDPDVWMARARLLAQWDDQERSAEAAWQRAIDLAAADDPMPLIHRGRWYAERGEHEKADGDFAKAVSLMQTPSPEGREQGEGVELNKFLEAGWWVVGPYPENLAEFCPPEIAPDPSKPVYVVDPKTGLSDQPVAWRSAPTGEFGKVDLRAAFNADHLSAYALNIIYSPDEVSTTLNVEADDGIRLWLNGQLVHEANPAQRWQWSYERIVPVTLRAGRNVVLAKVSQTVGPHSLSIRVADEPLDRAFLLAELGLWEEAAQAMRQADPNSFRDTWLSCRFAQLQMGAGDLEAYRRNCEWILQAFPKPATPFEARHLAWACTLSQDAAADADRIVRLAEQGVDSKERYSIAILARALYRAGRFDEAIERLGELADVRNPVYDVVRAMAHHRRGDADNARESLEKAQSWYDAATRSALAAPAYDLPHWHWNEFADFQILYREAQALIDATAATEDKNAAALLARAREELARQDPLTAAFDHALRVKSDEPQHYLARGRRLAELGRFNEAEADFNKAVSLAPADPDVLAARAVFFADRGEPDKAAADFHAALNLFTDPDKPRWRRGVPIDIEVARRTEVFEQLVSLRLDDHRLWLARVLVFVSDGRLDEAAAAVEHLRSSVHVRYYVPATLAILRSDTEELNRLRADYRIDDPYFETIHLGLAPTDETMTARLLAAAERMRQQRDDRWARRFDGMAQYRAGKFEEARVALESSLTSPSNPRKDWQQDGVSYPVLAMVHHRLRDAQAARRWLDKAALWLEMHDLGVLPRESGALGANNIVPCDWVLLAMVYYREAKELIDGPEALATLNKPEAEPARELGPVNASKLLRRARGHFDEQQYDEAIAVLTEAVERFPQSAEFWSLRGEAYALQEQWPQAAADFAKVVALRPPPRTSGTPTRFNTWHAYVLTHLAAAGQESYRAACADLLERFGESDDPEVVALLAWCCTIAPGVDDPEQLVQLADKQVGVNRAAIDLYKRATALYRAGRYEEARKQLDETVQVRGGEGCVWDWLFLAMTHHQLGHAEEAHAWLAKAAERLDDAARPRPHLGHWSWELDLRFLRREAEELIATNESLPPEEQKEEHAPEPE